MRYDPLKKIIGNAVRKSVILRKTFYLILGLLFLREWYVKRALMRIFTATPSPKKVYDAGSGFGQYSYFIANHFPKVEILAVDVKEEQIIDCSEFFQNAKITNVNFAVEDLTIPIHRNEFDLILSVDVMEHIPDDVGVFRNFSMALKENGILIVNTPSNLGGSDVHSKGEESFIEEHCRDGYSVDEIRNKLESAGLSIEEIVYTYGTYGNIAWKLGIKYPMQMLNKSKFFVLIIPFYYILTILFTFLLMRVDYSKKNTSGTGLLVIAKKRA